MHPAPPPESVPFLALHNVTVRRFGTVVLSDFTWRIGKQEHWAVVGSNGSGKTSLLEVIAGRLAVAEGEIRYHFWEERETSVATSARSCRDCVALISNDAAYVDRLRSGDRYYQQRFNAADAEQSPLTREFLLDAFPVPAGGHPPDPREQHRQIQEIAARLGIESLLERRLLKLSNGETKRVLIARALLKNPLLLLLDNPFVGLDSGARENLRDLITQLIRLGTKVLLVTSAEEIPEGITHVLHLDQGRITGLYGRESFRHQSVENSSAGHRPVYPSRPFLPSLEPTPEEPTFRIAVGMRAVNVAYGGKKALADVHWTVRKGEKWALLGPNGSGKSTLLSLITGDNPQAYANDLTLFDRPRGSGESIWDIKRQIGFVSPELHAHYAAAVPCWQVVASGYADSVGLRFSGTEPQRERIGACLGLLGIGHLGEQPFARISAGEQRLVLLARALVKDPPLLILDEPCQGLDRRHTEGFKSLVEHACRSAHRTLIYVTHYAGEIPDCVEKILRLDAGRVVETGERESGK
ncbi:MAG: ATP-binding cassette domain-containing protein [Ferruginibacter sp.]|nr:ATP-binding cassette domain-containing protein [Cytophagales bacterium]